MTKEKEHSRKPRPYGLDKRPKNVRLTPEAIRKLEIASEKTGMSESVYIEQALRVQFRKDDIE
jgi:hypothetical protein